MSRVCPECLRRTTEDATRCASDGTLLLDAGDSDDPRIGSVIGERFLVLDVLGSGGMGTIYRGYQLAMKREVALKVLAGPLVRDEDEVARFLREAERTARLRSPNTVVVHDCGKTPDGALYIAMELIRGRPLSTLIRDEGPLDVRRSVAIIGQVCDSLEEAHRLQIIHRDIKPSNIMLEVVEKPGATSDLVKVLDFGIAKALDAQTLVTAPGTLQGTPAYMAPELWSEKFGAVGPEADVYATGMTMFEMLTGRLPFSATSLPGFMHAHLEDEPKSPAVFRPELLGSAVIDVLARCLRKRPEDRYRSIGLLRSALAEVERQPGGVAAPRKVPTRRLSRLTLGGLVLGIAGFALAPWIVGPPTRADLAPPSSPPSAAPPTIATEPVPESPTSVGLPPPKAVRRHRVSMRDMNAVGVDGDDADAAFVVLRDPVSRCYDEKVPKGGAIRFYVIVGSDGRASSVLIKPDSQPAFRACIEDAMRDVSIPIHRAAFATLSAVVDRM